MKHTTLLPFLLLFSLFTRAQTQNGAWKGKLVYNFSGAIKEYDFVTKADRLLLQEAGNPFAANGEIYYIDETFRRRNQVVRKSNASQTQFKDVIDLTPDNPLYKPTIDAYSSFKGTGASAVMSSMNSPRVSPNGKWLALTVMAGYQTIYSKDAVVVFDIATGKPVAQFENKYGGSWTPDNRLVMSGADKDGSSDQSVKKGPSPGLFLSDASLQNFTRIDPGFDDPAPYHPAVSPDGRQVAFVLNNRVWVMGIGGENPRQLTAVDNDNTETYPQWSPDGRHVACWVYKTFERTYYTAIAVVPAAAAKPVVLSNAAPVWPRDARGFRVSGGSRQFSWVGDGPVRQTTTTATPPATDAASGPEAAAGPEGEAAGPKVGSKVLVTAKNGKTYKATVVEVKDGKFRVKYDGFATAEWLTKEQFRMAK